MKLSYVTDSLGHLPFEEMLDAAAELGIDTLEMTTAWLVTRSPLKSR